MTGCIRKLYILSGYREAYYQLPPAERGRIWQTVAQNETAAGASVLLSCDSRWCDESVAGWGVIEYPDMAAVRKAVALHEESDIYRHVEVQTFLGLPMDTAPLPRIDLPDPVYQLFLVQNAPNEAWAGLQDDARNRIFGAVMESLERNGGKPWLSCSIEWSNEEHSHYGVIAWPGTDALQAHFRDLVKIGWHRYIYARTILGTPTH